MFPKVNMKFRGGYADIYMKRSPLQPNISCEWLWEIKYVPESQRKNLPQIRQEALRQLNDYKQVPEFASRTDMKYAAIIFIGKKKFEILEVDSFPIS
jgi:hypothetical protein